MIDCINYSFSNSDLRNSLRINVLYLPCRETLPAQEMPVLTSTVGKLPMPGVKTGGIRNAKRSLRDCQGRPPFKLGLKTQEIDGTKNDGLDKRA